MKEVCVVFYVCGVNTTSTSVSIVGGTDGAGGDSGDFGGRRPGCPGAYGGSGWRGDLTYSGGPDGRVNADLGCCRSPCRECGA